MTYSKVVAPSTGSDGDAVTLANSQSDVLRQTAGAGSQTISTSHHRASGSRSIHNVGTSTSGLMCVEDTLPGLATFKDDFYFQMPSLASGEAVIRRMLSSGLALQGSLGISGNGSIVLRDTTTQVNSVPAVGERIPAHATNWYRIILELAYGTSGTMRARWYPEGSGTPTYDSGIVAANLGSSVFGAYRRGAKAGTSTTVSDFYTADLNMTGELPATVDAGPNQTNILPFSQVTFNGLITGGGTPSYSWTPPGGSGIVMVGATTATPTAIMPGAMVDTTYTFTLTDLTTSVSDTVDITVLAANMAYSDLSGVWKAMQESTL